jgi:fatty acid desaturase
MKLSDALSKDELREFSQPSDARAAFELVVHFAILVGAFAIATLWPNPLTIALGILLLAGRQQASGVIMHDCAHRAFFKSKALNEFVGHWLAGAAINAPLGLYREYHLKHHRDAGTEKDPDLWMVRKYPVAPDSLRRKMIRDLTGQTGVRDLIRELKMFKLSQNAPWIVFNVGLFTSLAIAGAAWAYLLWWAAKLFVYPLIFRLRQISEHGVAVNRASLDPRDNTSTTLVSWWERLFIAPANVNYHLEHHMFAAVPPYNLSRLHRLLSERGYYDGHACIARGYRDVLRRAVQRSGAALG